jgi:hypothetical protein
MINWNEMTESSQISADHGVGLCCRGSGPWAPGETSGRVFSVYLQTSEWINTPKANQGCCLLRRQAQGGKTLRHHQHHDQSHHSDLSKTKEKTSAAIVSVNEREVRYWIDVSQPFYLGLF